MALPSTFREEPQDGADGITHLTEREIQVLTMLAEGKTDGEIALQLCISPKTVAWHAKEMRYRLGASSRAHAVALAMHQGLLPVQPPPEQDS
jgi:DNA-binding CsgD family transcriptional regulator